MLGKRRVFYCRGVVDFLFFFLLLERSDKIGLGFLYVLVIFSHFCVRFLFCVFFCVW